MNDDSGSDPKKLTAKEKARAFRKEAYQKAKARHKERAAAIAASPAGLERAKQQKALRKAAYSKAKTRIKQAESAERETALRDQEIAAAAEAAEREAELRQMITTADQIKPARPRLTLVT
jgi:hypothetical protein